MMSEIFLPSVTHVIALTTIRRERILPVPGTIAVRVNEKVQAADVIAEAEIDPKYYYLDIAKGLGVSAGEVGRYLSRQQGERVDAGDVIAGPVGLTRRTVRAPADGRIATINNGRVLLEARGQLFQMRAGFPGVIVASDGAQIVTIETTGALVQGAWGNGKSDYGVMRVVGDGPFGRLQTNQLDVNLRGAVLVAGVCDHPAPLHQAVELSVRGVVLGAMTAELIPLARRLPFPILLTEGFGEQAITAPAFTLFMSHVGREVTIDAGTEWPQPGQRPEVVIPLSTTRPVGLPEEVIPIKAGVRVRILNEPYLGEVGVIKSVLKQAIVYESGIRAKSASVEIDGIGTTNVPLANIEVLQ
jgi:hypothetical protein